MRGPDRFLARRSRAAVGNQNTGLRALRFDEHLGERRVRRIGCVRDHREFHVAGELELARPQRSVGDLHAAQFDVVFGRDRDIQNGFDPGHAPVDFGAVGGKTDRDFSHTGRKRFVRGSPYLVGLQVADVDETAPRIERGVGAPARHIEVVPAAVASAGIGDHQGVPPVALQMHPGGGGLLGPQAIGDVLRARDVDRRGPRLGFGHGKARHRNALEQQALDGANPQIAVEAALHYVAMQHVVERRQAHPLVMCHVAIDHHAAGAVLARLARKIDGFVEPHRPRQPQIFQALQIGGRGPRVHLQGEHARIGRHDHLIFGGGIQRERRHAESAVLIDLVRIERAVGGLGNTPRHPVVVPVSDLALHRIPAGLIQHGIVEAAREQKRHQVFEHRSAPGQQDLPVG